MLRQALRRISAFARRRRDRRKGHRARQLTRHRRPRVECGWMVVWEKGLPSTFRFRESRRIVVDDRDDSSTLSLVEEKQNRVEFTLGPNNRPSSAARRGL